MWLRLCIVGIISRVGTSLGCLMFNSFPLNQLSKIVHRRLPVVTFRSNRSTDFHTFFPSFFLLRYSMICRAIYLEARLIDRLYYNSSNQASKRSLQAENAFSLISISVPNLCFSSLFILFSFHLTE